jgi:hypothetical protein
VKGGDDDAVGVAVEQSQSETLISPRIVERAEADQADVADGLRHDRGDPVVLLLHAADGRRRAPDRRQVVHQHAGHVVGRRVRENCLQTSFQSPHAQLQEENPQSGQNQEDKECKPKQKGVVAIGGT